MSKAINNILGRTIDISEGQSNYDRHVKNLLADKQIFPKIVKCLIDEFRDMSEEEILKSISSPQLGTEAVNPDGRIVQLNPEDHDETTGNVYFDLLTRAVTGIENPAEIYINIEAQNSNSKRDQIVERSIFYCSRLITRQAKEDISLARQEYWKLKKVCSIWICPDGPKEYENKIMTYQIEQRLAYGRMNWELQNRMKEIRYDLLRVIVVHLGMDTACDHELISMLNTLLSNSITAEEKKQLLKTEFGITATTELGKEIEEMSNLGYMLVKRGEEQGRKEERAKALKELEEERFRSKIELEEERSRSKIELEETEKRITEEKDIESVRHSYDLLKGTGLEKEEIIRRISENYRKSIEFVRSIVM